MTAPDRNRGSRVFRGLALVFVLTFVNLVGLLIAVGSLGILDAWSRWQFVGLFGLIEATAGISNILAPNIWHLPAAELETSRSTQVRLAASAMLLPHWGGAARAAAGICLMLVAGFSEGWAPGSLLFIPVMGMMIVSMLGVSAAIARFGVAYSHVDTIQFVVRWRERETELSPLSITASIQQFALGVLTLPAVKMLSPGALYQPEFEPSSAFFWVSLAVAAGSVIATALLWSGRIQWRAPREQQREAEQNA